jgi:hypothetical protein
MMRGSRSVTRTRRPPGSTRVTTASRTQGSPFNSFATTSRSACHTPAFDRRSTAARMSSREARVAPATSTVLTLKKEVETAVR